MRVRRGLEGMTRQPRADAQCRLRTLHEARGCWRMWLEEESVVPRNNHSAQEEDVSSSGCAKHTQKQLAAYLICPRLIRITLSLTSSVGADVVRVRLGSMRLKDSQSLQLAPSSRCRADKTSQLAGGTAHNAGPAAPDITRRQPRLPEKLSSPQLLPTVDSASLNAHHLWHEFQERR